MLRFSEMIAAAAAGLVLLAPALAPVACAQSAPAAAAPAAAPPTIPIVPLPQAVDNAATALFEKAAQAIGEGRVEFVIDPLIDGATGAQSNASHAVEKRILELVRARFPKFQPKPFLEVFLSSTPLVLVGTFTAISTAGQASAPRDAYRVCLTLADLRSQTVVAKGVARAAIQGVDARPSGFFNDTPVWADDAATSAYIKTCQGTKLAEKVDPAYTKRMLASSLIAEGIKAYEGRQYKRAVEIYDTALATDGGEQLRVYNGLYLAYWRLNNQPKAKEAFGRIIDHSILANKLGVRLLFQPGTARFTVDRTTAAQYPMWLETIAKKVAASGSCLDVVGHTSTSGRPEANEKLSAERSEFVKARLVAAAPELAQRITAHGRGSAEAIIGTGRDDASDAVDRRVEFKLRPCA